MKESINLYIDLEEGKLADLEVSSLQLSRDLDVHYKTAWVLAHKLREALAAETADEIVQGEVEIGGAYFGGHVRQENQKFRPQGPPFQGKSVRPPPRRDCSP
jgi:hypothetical protein